MIINFKHSKHVFNPVVVRRTALAVVNYSAKILGIPHEPDRMTSSGTFMSMKLSRKQISVGTFFFLLKGAGVICKDIVNFYCTVIRPVLEYCSPNFHHSLPVLCRVQTLR